MFNNPLAEARWLRFKANKRGFISLWIFTILFGLSLFAEIIANDKPLLVSYDNQWFVPVINEYAETEFGGEFETEATTKTRMLSNSLKTAVTSCGQSFRLATTQ